MYTIDERETIIRYDEYEECWYYSSNVRKHINHILKSESYFENIAKELVDGKVMSVEAKLSDLESFSVNPFVKARRKLSQSEKFDLAKRFKLNLASKMSKK